MAVEPCDTNRKENIYKMSTSPLARGQQFPQKVFPSMRPQGLTDASPLCPALLLCGCYGPALHAAPPAPCGQTQWQPATHLSALPHQALMCPSRCPRLPLVPWAAPAPSTCPPWAMSLLSQVSTLPGSLCPLAQPLQAPMRGAGKGCPEAPCRAHPEPSPVPPATSHPQGWAVKVRQDPHSQRPGTAAPILLLGLPKPLCMKASGELSLLETAWALLGHKKNPLTFF